MDFPNDYYEAHEVDLNTLDEFKLRQKQVASLATKTGLTFYWRGQADATWGLHSSLHRKVATDRQKSIADVMDRDVVAVERELVAEAREWIRPSVGARLATVDLFARLQHHGVPTRLVDFSKDPLVGLFFAVMEHGDVDGRVFVAAARDAVDETVKNSFAVPWAHRSSTRPARWPTTLVALDDHDDFPRISRQSGVFLTGGTPSTEIQRSILRGSYRLGARDVRLTMSIPLALHSWMQAEAAMNGHNVRGRQPTVATALTLRVPSDRKARFRQQLAAAGYSYRRLFPDPRGFLDYSFMSE